MNVLSKIFVSIFLLALTLKGYAQTVSFAVTDKSTGCDTLDVTFTNTSNPLGQDATYLWEFGNGSISQTFSPETQKFSKPGIYNVKLSMTIKLTTKTTTKTISIRPHPNAYFTVSDTFTIKTDKALPYVFRTGKTPADTINYKYNWKLDGIDLITHNSPNETNRDTLIRFFNTDGAYKMFLKTTDNFGCTDTFSRVFYVSQKLKIPNVFTPNGNGRYDFFQVETNGRTNYSLKIYTSAGQLVFKSLSKTIIWDGINYDGSAAIPGTYYYIIQAASEPIKKENCGFLMLLKER